MTHIAALSAAIETDVFLVIVHPKIAAGCVFLTGYTS